MRADSLGATAQLAISGWAGWCRRPLRPRRSFNDGRRCADNTTVCFAAVNINRQPTDRAITSPLSPAAGLRNGATRQLSSSTAFQLPRSTPAIDSGCVPFGRAALVAGCAACGDHEHPMITGRCDRQSARCLHESTVAPPAAIVRYGRIAALTGSQRARLSPVTAPAQQPRLLTDIPSFYDHWFPPRRVTLQAGAREATNTGRLSPPC